MVTQNWEGEAEGAFAGVKVISGKTDGSTQKLRWNKCDKRNLLNNLQVILLNFQKKKQNVAQFEIGNGALNSLRKKGAPMSRMGLEIVRYITTKGAGPGPPPLFFSGQTWGMFWPQSKTSQRLKRGRSLKPKSLFVLTTRPLFNGDGRAFCVFKDDVFEKPGADTPSFRILVECKSCFPAKGKPSQFFKGLQTRTRFSTLLGRGGGPGGCSYQLRLPEKNSIR